MPEPKGDVYEYNGHRICITKIKSWDPQSLTVFQKKCALTQVLLVINPPEDIALPRGITVMRHYAGSMEFIFSERCKELPEILDKLMEEILADQDVQN